MIETLHGNCRRLSGSLSWFEPVEPLGGIGHLMMTTRGGGLSRPPYASLNLGFHVGDLGERVRLNREAVRRAAGDRRLLDPVVGEQVHGCRARVVGELHSGTRWQFGEKSLEGTDALVTSTRRLPLVTLVADCLPVALVDPARQLAAAVHAGWRGLAEGVLEATLARMRATWGTHPGDVVAWLGPAIGPCCYEVGPEVAAHFLGSIQASGGGRCRLDLRAAAAARLAAAGVLEENLTGLPLCTSCRDDLFFSHRRTSLAGEKQTGRQAMLLWLEPGK